MTHLTAVGHVVIRRRVWQQNAGGLDAPADDWLNGQRARISQGARERCCRIGCHPQGFRRSAADLKRLAGISVSAERLRQIVEGQGHELARQRQSGTLGPAWRGADCRVPASASGASDSSPATGAVRSRVYVGIDGFMAPMVTEAEKQKRRMARSRRSHARRRARLRRGHGERYKDSS